MDDTLASEPSNRLIGEKSPYLLQHAYNPVDWYPWGDDAFEEASRRGQLVFLSVGYATCHWCHVMAHESFEDEAVAAYLNANFVSIKLDREERPDIDRIYMAVVQAMSGSGGWPMTVFLTPERKPVFGATYFPPRGAYGRPGFMDVLRRLSKMWSDKQLELEQGADDAIERIRAYVESVPKPGDPRSIDFVEAADRIGSGYDEQEGGFGAAPKFPRPSVLAALLRFGPADGDEVNARMALHTLDAMAAGGVHDHLGGGFHRYSVDRYWRVPHFEKMLYDQAQLLRVYVEAHQATGAEAYASTAVETADYVLRDLAVSSGGFASAEDADSAVSAGAETREGAFYLWEYEEVRAALADREADADAFLEVYGIEPSGNTISDPHEELGTGNVLYRSADRDRAAIERYGPELNERLRHARRTLLARRSERPRPLLDDKIISGWNGLMIGALAILGAATGRVSYIEAGARAADTVLDDMWSGGELMRRLRDGEARFRAELFDYAALADGLVELYQTGGDPRYVLCAEEIADALCARFAAPDGGFYDTVEAASDLLFRSRELHDGAEPSGLSLAIRVLTRVGRLLARADLQERASAAATAPAGAVERAPDAVPELAISIELALREPAQVVLAGEVADPEMSALRGVVGKAFLRGAPVLWAAAGSPLLSRHPELAAMAGATSPIAYVCKGFVCDRPTGDSDGLREQLAAI